MMTRRAGGWAGFFLITVLAAAGCKPAGGTKLEPVGQARMDIEHEACLKAGGQYLRLGKGQAFYCQIEPGDAGRICTKASDCESACLARSRTCAPVKPLFGCHEVLLDSGQAATLCVD
jgi:hypothetical protein